MLLLLGLRSAGAEGLVSAVGIVPVSSLEMVGNVQVQLVTDQKICGQFGCNAWPVVSGMWDLEMDWNVHCNAMTGMFAWMHHRLCREMYCMVLQEMCDMSVQNMQHTGHLEMCWNSLCMGG